MDKIAGIYKIHNLANNKVYIGQSYDVYGAQKDHFRTGGINGRHNKYLNNGFRKYGYNIRDAAGSNKGSPHYNDPEYRLIQKIAHKGLFKGSNNPFFEKTHTQISKLKMSQSHLGCKSWNKGKSTPEHTKIKQSNARKGRFKGQDNPFSKLTNVQADEIRDLFKNKIYSAKDLSTIYGINVRSIYRIIHYEHYNIKEEEE